MMKFRTYRTTMIAWGWMVLCSTLLAVPGCGRGAPQQAPEAYIQQYENDYQAAVAALKQGIAHGTDADSLRFKLGMLYFGRGEYSRAIDEFKQSHDPRTSKYAAQALFKTGEYTDALNILDADKNPDDETRYYYGLTCEKLNLFDKALTSYKAIKDPAFAALAHARMNAIEKEVSTAHIRDIDPAVARVIAEAPSLAQFPQAGALILLSDEKTEITADNREIDTLHYVVKILNERGKEGFSETHVEYDSTYEKVSLEYARTIKPDGTVVEVGSRHIRDVTKYLNFPLYSNARVYIISFPEIAEGATIEYKVRIDRNQLINKKDFAFGFSVQTEEPIIAAYFSLKVPRGRTVFTKILNERYNDFGANLKPVIEQGVEETVHRWEFHNIPQIIPEAGMPPAVKINPIIVFSTFGSWQDVYQWWWELAKDKMRADEAIKAKVKELALAASSAEEKLRAIYNFCAKDIRYVAVEYGQAGYEPHQAADIFRNKYGDCKDQAVLLVTMLKEAGFTAWPVLIGTAEAYNLDEQFPMMLFNHAIAVVSWEGRLVFLDPTAETCSFGDLPSGDQERNVLICKEAGYAIATTPLYPAAHNLVKQLTSITLHDDESIAAEKSISSLGIYDQAQRYWFLYTVPDIVKEQLASKIQEISIGAKLLSYTVTNLNNLNKPVGFSYAFTGPEYFTMAGALRIMPQLASLDTSIVAKEKRRYPIEFGYLDTKAAQVNLLLPEHFVVKYTPEAITQDSPWMAYSASYQQQGRTLLFRQKLETKVMSVAESEYPAFKAFVEGLAKKIKQRVVLERK